MESVLPSGKLSGAPARLPRKECRLEKLCGMSRELRGGVPLTLSCGCLGSSAVRPQARCASGGSWHGAAQHRAWPEARYGEFNLQLKTVN